MTREEITPNMSHKEMIDTLKGLVFGTFDRTTAKEREALDMAIKALEQESCKDAVSREEAFEGLNSLNGTAELDMAFEVIEKLPSVTPIHIDRTVQDFVDKCRECGRQKKGKWIPIPFVLDYESDAKCSLCHDSFIDAIEYNYCPNCGAKMEGEVEDADSN